MKTKTAETLIKQLKQAQRMGRNILTISGLEQQGVVYAFATQDTLVINCKDHETAWRFDEGQVELWQAIADLSSSTRRILIEMKGKLFFEF